MSKNKFLWLAKSAVIRTIYFTRKMFHISRYLADIAISRLFYKEKIVASPGMTAAKSKKNLCIFSHFDPHNIIDPYVIYYLQALSKADCDIIFVTTCSELSSVEKNKITDICKKIILKKNRGLDFGAYKCGIETEKNLDNYEKLILANDSVYGPFFDLNALIMHGEKNQLDMWGATDSYMIKSHIQSYFVVFSRSLFLNPSFKKFWDKVYYLNLKNNIIIRYEIGMSQYFLKNGFKLGAYCTCPTLENRVRHDPTHHSWSTIILDHQYPFIKRMLIRENPHEVDNQHWEELIKKVSSFDIKLIIRHLKRTTLA